MSNEKIVLDLDKGLSAEQTASIPRLFKEKLEEVVTGNPEDISAIHLEDENDTMVLIGKSGNALGRLVTMSILEDEEEFIFERLKDMVNKDISKKKDIDLISVYNIAYRNGEEDPFIFYKDKETGEEKPIYGFCYKTVTVAVKDDHYAFNLFYFIPEYSPENNYSVVRTKGKMHHYDIACISSSMKIGEDEIEVVNAIWDYLSPEEVDTIFENGGVYEVPCSECISVDFILYVIDSMVDSKNLSKEEFLLYIDSEDRPEGYLN